MPPNDHEMTIHPDDSARLTRFLKDAHTATLASVRIYGWWSGYTLEEIHSVVRGEIQELNAAIHRRDYHGPHGVLQEAMDSIVVLSKMILRLQDMTENGEI